MRPVSLFLLLLLFFLFTTPFVLGDVEETKLIEMARVNALSILHHLRRMERCGATFGENDTDVLRAVVDIMEVVMHGLGEIVSPLCSPTSSM